MQPTELKAICSSMINAAIEAGAMIARTTPDQAGIVSKKNSTDIVTEVDQHVEHFLRASLLLAYPDIRFLGEESHDQNSSITDDPTFIVDPIDGTSNFVHGFPDVGVSIGLASEQEAIIGVVYNPVREELWYAVKGQGAFRRVGTAPEQRLPLSRSALEGLQSACVGIEFGSDREGPNFEFNMAVFDKLLRTKKTGGRFVNSLRATGSAAIAICRVASTQQDAFWECGSWAWDVAAAWCILLEAGGCMVDGHPGNWNPPLDNRRYLAVRPAISGQKEFVEEFWSTFGDRRSSYGPPQESEKAQ
ncbi:hypothetical protein KCU98_g6028, partial [Aureobasidium melanogenum]